MVIISGVPIFRIFTVITLDSFVDFLVSWYAACSKYAGRMANSADPDQTAPSALNLCCSVPVFSVIINYFRLV